MLPMNSDPAYYYNLMAEHYARKSETDIHNVYYNLPAIKALLPPLEGKKVLEVGCGGGLLTEWLIKQKAKVTAVDISEKMVALTKRRVGKKAKIVLANISTSLDFVATASIDVIICSLVLHYVNNWLPVFAEFQRVLKANGSIVISTHHPHADWLWFNRPTYFKKELYEDQWVIDGQTFTVKFYHRTLANMFAIFKKYSFYVETLLEPLPLPDAKSIDPKTYARLLAKPHFLFLRLKKLPSSRI